MCKEQATFHRPSISLFQSLSFQNHLVFHYEVLSNEQWTLTGNDFPRSKHTYPNTEGMKRRTEERPFFPNYVSRLNFTVPWNPVRGMLAARKKKVLRSTFAGESNFQSLCRFGNAFDNDKLPRLLRELRVIPDPTFVHRDVSRRNNIRSVYFSFNNKKKYLSLIK